MAKLTRSLQGKIDDIKVAQTRIEKNLEASKKGVKTALVSSVKKVMSVEDFTHNQQYLTWYNNSYVPTATATGTVLNADDPAVHDMWLEELKKDGQTNLIDLLAEYSIDAEREQGRNNWEKELNDAQEAKKVTKKAVAVQATQVIASYKRLIEEHEKTIQELRNDVKSAERDIQAKTKELADMQSRVRKGEKISPEAVKVVEDEVARLTGNKEKLEKELASLEKQTSLYKKEIEQSISELEETLKLEGIYVGTYEGLEEKSQESESAQSINSGYGSARESLDDRKAKDIARAMMTDFRSLAPEEIMEMVEHTGYGDLLNMSRELGPINRKNFDRVMQNRLEDLQDGFQAQVKDENGNPQTITLTSSDLINLSDLDDNQFSKVRTLMKYYTDNYHTMSVHERREAERIMNYLKISTLLTESKRGAIGRFFGRFTEKGTRINEMGNSLSRFATERGKRESKKWERNQDIRTRLGIKTAIPSTTRKKHINRSGHKPINMEMSD